ncbi:OLD family endonuclease [Clostridium sp. chh4-2]|uniref:ATP-dependent nuclease n=1 Tax=Clostridium sp. chh4-2 TaxID=2067550 RepID=UPI000CCEF977|nr:AAA family ATPase [Clostridium sp. chh4-2]PNV61134.1 OLD family endonuclease [Clostridium sp. chh4-2]
MRLADLHIKNFNTIRDMKITDIEDALILVGKNNTGKTAVLNAVRALSGDYEITIDDFNEKLQNIEIEARLEILDEDLDMLHKNGVVSQYKRFDAWKRDFLKKLPSFRDHMLEFKYVVNQQGTIRYFDGFQKNNRYVAEVFPKIYFIDTQREVRQLQEDLLMFQEDELLKQMRSNRCIFTANKRCNHCFQCIGLINQKKPEELNAFETARLLEYKLYQLNLDDFARRVNRNFHKNGGFEEIQYLMDCDIDRFFKVQAISYNKERMSGGTVENMSKGMKSIYMLSLLETYIEEGNRTPSIIMVEDPEIFLHPQLQKMSGEILYRLSKLNQVIFTTYSPNFLFNFNTKQIRQVVLDQEYYAVVKEKSSIDAILDDLGYAANDFMNVSFVFIVEGRQDKSRLPLLLEKYYSEIYDEEGHLARVSIITTNSCTNIKTYANLKYMNQVSFRDQFLMIRDGDGKDPEVLAKQLCKYYDDRNLEDVDKLPKVTRRNVLILKYYSFENYFLNPSVMAKLGIVKDEEEFYRILFGKWKEYLYRMKSGQHLVQVLGKGLNSIEDLKDHMEEFLIYMRGHNLYDIFYGPYKDRENEILKQYIDLAPREDFADILDAVDRFVYFDNRKKNQDL